ncbi:MAG: Txe/YoeB family addiction module toxin [Candidatus Adiutrix sp.]|jgi:toxin YoeB|nr:Txe/YoeB family addiction module toxin [Candidatus Adiutrix sp.]
MKINFTETGWADYLYWQRQDKKTLKKINLLIVDISRHGHDGLGKPEPLKGEGLEWWSRHIDEKNRLIYQITGEDTLEIAQCRSHYGEHQARP